MIGSGSWAGNTSEADSGRNQEKISWYVRDEEMIDQIQKMSHNPYYLQSVKFDPDRLFMSSDINEVVDSADVPDFLYSICFFYARNHKTNDLFRKQVHNNSY